MVLSPWRRHDRKTAELTRSMKKFVPAPQPPFTRSTYHARYRRPCQKFGESVTRTAAATSCRKSLT